VVRGENGHAVSSYTDPPSSEQFERLAQDVQKLRYAAEETNAALKRLPEALFVMRSNRRLDVAPTVMFVVISITFFILLMVART